MDEEALSDYFLEDSNQEKSSLVRMIRLHEYGRDELVQDNNNTRDNKTS